LNTLSDDEFRNGLAEVVKYAIILDKILFDYLEQNYKRILLRDSFALNRIIKRCCELKKSVVEKDEKENDYRRILNFGHTIGHAIEQLSHYRLSHGKSIAIGMAAEAKISHLMGIIDCSTFERITNLLKLFGLPTDLPLRYSAEEIISATHHDKKIRQGKVLYTLPRKFGKAYIGVPLSDKAVIKFLTA
jgi:3-dehydroquinate synthase